MAITACRVLTPPGCSQDEADVFLDYEDPRTLAQIVEAEQEFFDRVSYARHHVHYDEDDPEMADDRRAGTAVDLRPGAGDGGRGVLRAHRRGPAADDGQQECCLKKAGREHLVDHRATAPLQHAAELAVGSIQVLNQGQDVAAPDQVS